MSEAYEVIGIDEGSWRIDEGFVRCYLLAGTERALLVDTGAGFSTARAVAAQLTNKPLLLCNTHGDPDHIAGNAAFPEVYLHPAEEENYRAFGGPGAILPLRGGDVLDLGERALEVIELPGHTPGSIALLDRSRRVLLGGDAVQDGRIYMFGPRRDLRAYLRSMRALQKRAGEFDAVWPAHGSFPVSPAIIAGLCLGAERILAEQVSWTPFEVRGGMTVRLYDVGCADFLLPNN